MRTTTALFLAAALVAAGVPAAGPARASDAISDLDALDVKTRLSAVERLSKGSVEGAEKALLDALNDKDWEVIERAATALGTVGSEESLKKLTDLAVDGPIRRIRHAAVDSVSRLDLEQGITLLTKHTGSKKTGEAAFEALARLAGRTSTKDAVKALDKGLKNKDAATRAAAASGLTCLPPEDGAKRLPKLLKDKTLGVRTAAIEAVIEHPHPDYRPILLDELAKKDVPDVVERRVHAALHSIVASAVAEGQNGAEVARPVLEQVETAKTPEHVARVIRAISRIAALPRIIGEERPDPLVAPSVALEALAPTFEHKDDDVRAAAVNALGVIGADAALEKATELAKSDTHWRVRLHALRAVLAHRNTSHDATFDLAADRLQYDPDLLVREEAAVALGRKGVRGAVDGLAKTMKAAMNAPDTHWALGSVAAISIGKTRDPKGVAPLLHVKKEAKDWRLRASAIAGLGHISQPEAIEPLIDALESKSPVEVNSAFEALRRLTTKKIGPKAAAWQEWWNEVRDSYTFVDREEEARKARKYGYAPTNVGVYEGLDVIVFTSRGDSIEKLLTKLEIAHRTTQQASVGDAGLHPWGLFVSNCTGEMTTDDRAQLQWFVRTGGYLFCSCWALHHTAEHIYPAMKDRDPPVRKLKTKGQVLDNVIAEACPTDSPYLDEVFDGVTRPIYVLYGAHLIEVLDRERAEVLIDSPDCATRWGGGNLAAWYTAGHGVILTSSNHFDLQGLEKASSVSKPDELMAYAADHMGMGYEELRKLEKDGTWKSKAKAHKAARDLSAFRFITNFVRTKRKQDN